MQPTDLTVLGRLGGLDSQGFFHLMIKPEYRELLDELDEVFLIFSSDRVFYVSISDTKETDKKLWIRFAEDGIAAERTRHKEAYLAIAPEDIEDEDEEALDVFLGSTVYHGDKPLGVLKSSFFNGAQDVLEIELPDGKELLVPYVDYYVLSAEEEPPRIVLQNLDSLLEESE